MLQRKDTLYSRTLKWKIDPLMNNPNVKYLLLPRKKGSRYDFYQNAKYSYVQPRSAGRRVPASGNAISATHRNLGLQSEKEHPDCYCCSARIPDLAQILPGEHVPSRQSKHRLLRLKAMNLLQPAR